MTPTAKSLLPQITTKGDVKKSDVKRQSSKESKRAASATSQGKRKPKDKKNETVDVMRKLMA